jgi:hypothetical protein
LTGAREIIYKRQLLFGVPEEKMERMNLSSIFRYNVKHDIRAHPILYVDILHIAKQRIAMAHEFLAMAASLGDLAGMGAMRLPEKQLSRWVLDLEFAFQRYLILKETNILYTDSGCKPQTPGDDGRCYVRAKKKS